MTRQVLCVSDFGRTLRSNGVGTDHAWGGHYWVLGGGVRGGRVHGRYPDSLADDGPLNVRAGGRFLPTTSWTAVWHAIALEMGVEAARLADVLPNLAAFAPGGHVIDRDVMYE